MIEVLPAILADDAETFRERLSFPGFWQPGMTAHIDILDGSMFGATCFCDPTAIRNPSLTPPSDSLLRKEGEFPGAIELHCMIRNPLPVIEHWKAIVPQTVRTIIHAEIHRPLDELRRRVRGLDLEFGVAFCPETSTDLLEQLPELPDRVLVMGVQPGASGRAFIGDPILAKIRRLHTQHPALHITVDGGVTTEHARGIFNAGASSLVAASAIWAAPHPREQYEQLIHSCALHG
jgi:ribulose-phosphate 3-epimerase